MRYVALLRGINVGGNNIIKMAELRQSLEDKVFVNVTTYIQSGNILFDSTVSDTRKLANLIEKHLLEVYKLTVPTLVVDSKRLQSIVEQAPKQWATDPEWKYNVLFVLEPYDIDNVIEGIGELKPDIETITAGNGAIYQSVSMEFFGRARTGKLASLPVYKQITIRNWNTALKLCALLDN